MRQFLRCFFSVFYCQFLGLALVGALLWVTGTPSGSSLSVGAMLFGSALGVSLAIYDGQFIDHRQYVKQSHWIHQNDDGKKDSI